MGLPGLEAGRGGERTLGTGKISSTGEKAGDSLSALDERAGGKQHSAGGVGKTGDPQLTE